MNNFFQGLYTALPTPFLNNKLDFPAFKKIIDFQVLAEVAGIIVAGSTGESASLTIEEYYTLIESAVGNSNKKLQVIAGVSTNDTAKAIEMAVMAEKLRADGLMCVTPYYNKPSQLGLIKHFTAIHDAVNIPIMLYSVPSRTGVDFTDETIVELAKLPRILGLKDATNDITRPLRLARRLKKEFSFLAGDDIAALAYNVNGGIGCVSVVSNIVPKLCKDIQRLMLEGEYIKARTRHLELIELFDLMFIEANPVPIKYVLSLLDFCKADIRPPLCELKDVNKELIKSLMRKIDLLQN